MLASNPSFLVKLRAWKQRAFWRALVFEFCTKFFSHQLSRLKVSRSFTLENILACNPAIASLNKEKNYFLFHASYGDKWCILSYLAEHVKLYSNSFVIASHRDRALIEIFLGPSITAKRFIFINQEPLNYLSGFFRPSNVMSSQLPCTEGYGLCVTPFFIEHGLPPGTIRHLHIVYYPYFNELFFLHGVPYGTLLKLLLYLPAAAKPSLPAYYCAQDYIKAKAISSCSSSSSSSSPGSITALFNVVNFSHASLSTAQISLLISTLESHGYRVLLNVTQSSGFEELNSVVSAIHRTAVFISVPPTLLALVCDNVRAVIGVLGGAMNVAVQFSGAHVLSLQTTAIGTGCSEDDLLGQWGKERIWESYNQDWPCLYPGRVVENKFIGDLETLVDADLVNAVKPFLEKIGSVGLAT